MVKLKSIILDDIVYSKQINPKHQKHIDNIGGRFLDFDIRNFMTTPPPKNSSRQTFNELRNLEVIIPDINVKAADKTREYFSNALEILGLEYPKDEINKIVKDSRGIIHKLKYYYNRPRPAQIAKAMGLKFHEQPLATANTPAYPSGHSAQGRLIARYLSDLYPDHSKEIMKIGDEVSKSRLIAKIHYQSDSEFGLTLGDALYKHYKNKLTEVIKIPIEVGDVVLGGKFKNKKITVKSIGTNEKGDVTINGKSILRVRPIPKLKEIMKEGKGMLSIFDFDDTLVKSDSWVYIVKNGKTIKKLDAAEFAMHTGLKKDEEYDFRDFDKKLRSPRLIKKNVDLLRKQLKKGGRKVTILTARRLGAPINSFFKTIGIQPYVVTLGSGDPKKKADYIEREIKKGYDPIYFMDDSPKNIKAVDSLKKKYPHISITTSLVK